MHTNDANIAFTGHVGRTCKQFSVLARNPNANALRGRWPVMQHAHEKVHWMYVDGMGIVSLDPRVPERHAIVQHGASDERAALFFVFLQYVVFPLLLTFDLV